MIKKIFISMAALFLSINVFAEDCEDLSARKDGTPGFIVNIFEGRTTIGLVTNLDVSRVPESYNCKKLVDKAPHGDYLVTNFGCTNDKKEMALAISEHSVTGKKLANIVVNSIEGETLDERENLECIATPKD